MPAALALLLHPAAARTPTRPVVAQFADSLPVPPARQFCSWLTENQTDTQACDLLALLDWGLTNGGNFTPPDCGSAAIGPPEACVGGSWSALLNGAMMCCLILLLCAVEAPRMHHSTEDAQQLTGVLRPPRPPCRLLSSGELTPLQDLRPLPRVLDDPAAVFAAEGATYYQL